VIFGKFLSHATSDPHSSGISLIVVSCLLYDSGPARAAVEAAFSFIMSSIIRPCLRISSVPKTKQRPIRIPLHAQPRRAFADRRKPPNPLGEGSRTVWAPKTRLALGVVFIGAMVYSMVNSRQYKTISMAIYSRYTAYRRADEARRSYTV
jgi:hypothetical protein